MHGYRYQCSLYADIFLTAFEKTRERKATLINIPLELGHISIAIVRNTLDNPDTTGQFM